MTQISLADVDVEPEKILKTTVNNVLSVLSDKQMSIDQKEYEINEITNSIFSFPLMAKLSLGKELWYKLNADQKKEFTHLFIKIFQSFYADKINLFLYEKVVFDSSIIENEKRVKIPTTLLSDGKKVSMLYKMYKTQKGWKIYDIEIEGVSLIQTYRSQFNHILKSNEVEVLLTKMRE